MMEVMERLPQSPFSREDASLPAPDVAALQSALEMQMHAPGPSTNLSPRLGQLHSYELSERASSSGLQSGEAAHGNVVSPSTASLLQDLFAQAASGTAQASEDERALARARQLQDKNKRAQQRYRVRQKEKLEDYKRQVEELTQAVEALAQDKAALENRTRLLETVMQMREERALAPAQQEAPVLAQAEGPFANETVLSAVQEYVAAVRDSAEAPAPSLEDLRRFSLQDLSEVNVQFASALSRWLVQPRVSEPGHEPHERLCTLVQTGRAVRMLVARVDFSWLRLLESGSGGASMHPAAWQRALAGIRLTPEQKRALLQSRNRLLARMISILQRRSKVLELASSTPSTSSSAAVSSPIEVQMGPSTSSGWASDAYRASLQEEHQAVVQFLSEVTSDLSPISPLQEARLIVEAFPCRYEPLTLCNCIAAIENQVGTILPVLQAYLAPAGQGTGAGIQAQLLLPDSPFRAMLTPAQEAGTATSGLDAPFQAM